MKQTLSITMILWLGLSPLASQAEVTAGLSEIYQLAEENDAKLKAAQAMWQSAQEFVPLAQSKLRPSVNLSVGYSGINQNSSNSNFEGDYQSKNYSVSASQPIFNRGFQAEKRKAKHETQREELRLELEKQDLIVRVAVAYFKILEAMDSLVVAKSAKEAYAHHLKLSKTSFEVGLVAKTNVYESQARFDLAHAQEIQAENAIENSMVKLKEIIGIHPGKLANLRHEVPLAPPAPNNLDDWLKVAATTNPNVRVAMADSESAREEIERQRSGDYPTVNVVAEHKGSYGALNAASPDRTNSNTIGLQLGFSLYQGGAVPASIRQAQAQFRLSQEKLDSVQRQVKSSVEESYRGILSGISQVKAYQQSVLSNTSALEATQGGFEVGIRTLTDVLDAESALYNAKLNYAVARYNYTLSRIHLKQAAGTLSVEDINEIDGWLQKRTSSKK